MTRVHILVEPGEVFHLPDKHNQKSHGNRAGKKDNVPSKTSKHAPLSPKSSDGPPAKKSPASQQKAEPPKAEPPKDEPKQEQKQEQKQAQEQESPKPDPEPQREAPKKSPASKPMTPTQFEARAAKAARGDKVYKKLVIGDNMTSVAKVLNSGKLKGVSAEDVRNAYQGYTDVQYIAINERLRETNDPDNLPDERRATVMTLDKVMSVSPLSGDIIIHRAIKNPAKMFGDSYVRSDEPDANRGLTWEDNAFVSTTADVYVAESFRADVVMNILVPKGTLATGTPVSEYPSEREIILMRGLRYRVVSSYREDPTDPKSREVFNVEVIT